AVSCPLATLSGVGFFARDGSKSAVLLASTAGAFTVGNFSAAVSSGSTCGTGEAAGSVGTVNKKTRSHFGHFGLYLPGLGFFTLIVCEQYGHGNGTAATSGAIRATKRI